MTLFEIKGIRICVDWSWFLILFLIVYSLSGFYADLLRPNQATLSYLLAVASALLFFASILMHELGHAFAAVRSGIGIRRITLWMFGGLAELDRDSDSPGTEFKIAAAGPAVTLLLAGGFSIAGIAFAGSSDFWAAMRLRGYTEVSGGLALLAWLASVNFLLLAFNLIPAYPLDGGRIARSIAWRITGDRNRATAFAAKTGRLFGYLFILWGLRMMAGGDPSGGIWLAVIGFMLATSARATVAQTEISKRVSGLIVADVMDTEPVAIPESHSVEQALDEFFLRYRWPWFPVVDADQRFTGLLQRGTADAIPEDGRAATLVSEVADRDSGALLRVLHDAPLDTLLGNQYLRKLGGLAAVDHSGRLRGVLTLGQLGRALRDALGNGDGGR